MNKRDMMFSLVDGSATLPYVPAAFFLHFSPEFHKGATAINKHLEYFRTTDMDFVKIQFEAPLPHIPDIQRPEDWARMPSYRQEYFGEQIEVVRGIVNAVKQDAAIVVTLYSPFMGAQHTTSSDIMRQHLTENPDAVKRGMEIITESMLYFVRECIKAGVDGFYHSTQGGETGRFGSPPDGRRIFEQYIKPYDLAIMNEINQVCPFNILHVCDYQLPYDDFAPFKDYPGHIVNSPLHVGDREMTPAEAADYFKRPFMGGLERKGTLATGSPDQIRAEAKRVLDAAPSRFILGADCTVPSDTPWNNLKIAISTAHEHTSQGA